jgi:hypothetical protein
MLATAFVAAAAQRPKRNRAPGTVFLAGAASIIAGVLLSTRLAAITIAQVPSVRRGSGASGEKGLVSALIGEHRLGDAALGGPESLISVASPVRSPPDSTHGPHSPPLTHNLTRHQSERHMSVRTAWRGPCEDPEHHAPTFPVTDRSRRSGAYVRHATCSTSCTSENRSSSTVHA